MKKEISYERYQRQMILPDFGERAQQLLVEASVLVIGAGGLGCPALLYLAGAGVGTIGIADGDTVALSNLHRQVLYHTSDIGKNKAVVAAEYLKQLNPGTETKVYPWHVTNENLLAILGNYDIVLDGTDNFATRYLINDACVLMHKTLVYGAVSRFEGQVAVFNGLLGHDKRSANYRDIFPEPPKENEVPNCADAGVIGILPGMIGCMQAGEVIKLITGMGDPLIDRVLTYNVLSNQFYTVNIIAGPATNFTGPSTKERFLQTDYVSLCKSPSSVSEIDVVLFEELLNRGNVDVIDVRELYEQPVVKEFEHLRIPLADIYQQELQLKNDVVVVICQSGKRSRIAVEILNDRMGTAKTLYSLRGGLNDWYAFLKNKRDERG
ncbi:HesA/MoeB/ThiF family protein [Sediminibacterium goheungense]|uniref:Molybdopterin-synthase adenylyltransferase n=1 Tax=Sediminibacterium goheungense TaxID=1086393 RepID=A0A4R6ITH8_9BACT|nr:HesA/MoeB/ThiF family protein [Sediminibacterium goheungense]TDO25823.1 adenylyltransferase/sulfurtransferase [Sediminibacterium goheungense]